MSATVNRGGRSTGTTEGRCSEMRALRGIAAVVVWLLATVLLIVSVVLCITLILLPLGIPLMLGALRLYGYGVQLMMPRPAEVKRHVRGQVGLRPRGSAAGDVKRAGKRARGVKRDMRNRARGMKRDIGKGARAMKSDVGKRAHRAKRDAGKRRLRGPAPWRRGSRRFVR